MHMHVLSVRREEAPALSLAVSARHAFQKINSWTENSVSSVCCCSQFIVNVSSNIQKRGDLNNWREFAHQRDRYPWMDLRENGVYCLYCRHGCLRGSSRQGNEVFPVPLRCKV